MGALNTSQSRLIDSGHDFGSGPSRTSCSLYLCNLLPEKSLSFAGHFIADFCLDVRRLIVRRVTQAAVDYRSAVDEVELNADVKRSYRLCIRAHIGYRPQHRAAHIS